ncbi:hypothetical protein MNEG_7697 [Monoraphidium neglectum]|uniref:Uncharacterized protein n=1 Tax=Monoraphidium neglectum TaxID=145388 RepID=A0A0D2MHU9_9CHLO|nr:hypothetical protein MNEG_7697 [Monoraphidium neglectum]KIZ00262.1 hypothetical protein MNEG_7697 [Monoraphidium neglectum]|eukprot:XP_013899281.1 hypothetical protein MNEG_7697 [Monoraphidium neglectum]
MESAEELAGQLDDAIDLYEQQVSELQQGLSENPDEREQASEALELLAQLEEALREAREARASLQAGLGAPPQGRDNATHSNGAAPASDVAAAPQVEAEAAGGADESGHMRDRSAPTRMHPENFYFDREPDFAALAERYPALRPFLVQPPLGGRPTLDWTSWHATRELTRTLLAADYGVTWSLPDGQLVPPVPNRANYIHWIQDLLQLSSPPGGAPINDGT